VYNDIFSVEIVIVTYSYNNTTVYRKPPGSVAALTAYHIQLTFDVRKYVELGTVHVFG
jgi:hypothetical protein